MSEWLKGCEVCNAGLCARFDELIESGEGYREAARLLEDEQKEKLGEVVYSYSSLLSRYYRNKPQVFRNETLQQSGVEKTGEEWPKCSKCYRRRVEKNYRTGKPNDNGLCTKCRTAASRKKKYEEGQRKLDQAPIDPESDQYWKEMVEKLNELFGGFKGIPCGKISEETYNAFHEIRRQIDTLSNRFTKQYVFILK